MEILEDIYAKTVDQFVTNIKEAQTSALPKQSELLLHNNQNAAT